MTISDGLMILAVLIASFLAVFAQKQIELWREQRSRKIGVFKTLMTTRGRPLSIEHVQALNMIDLEFTKTADKEIITAWKEYHDHLNSYPKEGENQKEKVAVWTDRLQGLLKNLLEKMGESLGYAFDPVQIRKGVYAPMAHALIDIELQVLRRMALEWLSGDRKVSVSLVPKDEESAKNGQKFLEGILGIVEGQKQIKIEVVKEQGPEKKLPAETSELHS